MKRTICTLLALSTLSACAGQQAVLVDVASCVYQDEKLGVAVKDPAKARAYLEDLLSRVKSREDGAITEAAALLEDALACIPKKEPAAQ